VVLASKFFGNLFPGDPNGGGAGRGSVIAQVDESLRRLRTDYLDLYWLHNWDRSTPIEETMRTLDDLVRAGKVRYLGFSNTPAWLTAQAQLMAQLKGWTPLTVLQVEYSLLARTVEGELAPLALDQGLALVPWSPLKNGFLSGKYRRGRQVTDSVRTAHNLAGLEVPLTPAHLRTLDEVSAPVLSYPAPMHGALRATLQFAGTTVDGEASAVYPPLVESSVRY
jgi:aryl-alcohol dehydrogenase (NADP+)